MSGLGYIQGNSDLWHIFDNFFSSQNKQNFKNLKDFFTQFTIQHTKINGKTECGRIFTKILNPLAFINKSKGARQGYISSTNITFDELRYNRINWRDELSGKDKQLTRKEYEKYFIQIKANVNYSIQKAKKLCVNATSVIMVGCL